MLNDLYLLRRAGKFSGSISKDKVEVESFGDWMIGDEEKLGQLNATNRVLV